MTPEPNMESTPSPAVPAARNLFSRLIGVYFSPRETFREIGQSPRVLVPMIVMVVLGFLLGFYMTKRLDMQSMLSAQFDKQVMEGRLTKEQVEQQMPIASKIIGVQILIAAALGNVVVALVVAGVFKLISTLIGAENRFKSVFSVTLHTMIAVSIISSALFALILSFRDPSEITFENLNSLVSSNLGAVLTSALGKDGLPKFIMKLAGWVDVFAIWMISLLAVGYSAVSQKLKTGTAATCLGVLYGIVAVIGSIIGALRG
ncbi:MAG TPA: YIP1 family protein [Acidobacteriota bacterium]|nr:YIP1 family protein [Acidobacteriota bacterium]